MEADGSNVRRLTFNKKIDLHPDWSPRKMGADGSNVNDEALAWLKKACKEREPGMIYLKVKTALDPLRSEPRFQDLLRYINFPE